MLRIQLKALILEVIPLFEDGIKLQGESVPHELVLNGRLELFEQPHQFADLHFVTLHELLLVSRDGFLHPHAHALGGCLDAAQEALDGLALLRALVPDFHL